MNSYMLATDTNFFMLKLLIASYYGCYYLNDKRSQYSTSVIIPSYMEC